MIYKASGNGSASRPLVRNRYKNNQWLHKIPQHAVQLPQRVLPSTTLGRILASLRLERGNKIAKFGIKLLFISRSHSLIHQVFSRVCKEFPVDKKRQALQLVRKRAKQLKLQLPSAGLTIQLPWCSKPENMKQTSFILQSFAKQLFTSGFFQPSCFTNGRLKVRIVWKPTGTFISCIRTASRYNRN